MERDYKLDHRLTGEEPKQKIKTDMLHSAKDISSYNKNTSACPYVCV